MKKTIIASLLISSFLVCSYISFSTYHSNKSKLDLAEDKESKYGLIEEVKQLDI